MNTTTQSSEIGYREVYSLVLEALSKKGKGTFDELINEVFRLGEEKGTIQVPSGRKSSRMESSFQPEIPGQYKSWVGELVRQAMWECLIKGLLMSLSGMVEIPRLQAKKRLW